MGLGLHRGAGRANAPEGRCQGAEKEAAHQVDQRSPLRMPKPAEVIASELTSEQRAILACAAIGVNHVAVGFTDRAVQLMVIRGLIVHRGNRYVLTETGLAVFEVLLERGRAE